MLGHWSWWSQGAGLLHLPGTLPGESLQKVGCYFESCRQHLLKADGWIPEAGSLTRDSAAGKWTRLHKEKAYSAEYSRAERHAEPGRQSWQHPVRWQQVSAGRLWVLSNTSMETYQFLCSSPWERELIHVSGFPKLDAPVRRMLAVSHAARCPFSFPSSPSASLPSAQCTCFQELSVKTWAVLRQKALTAFMPSWSPTAMLFWFGAPLLNRSESEKLNRELNFQKDKNCLKAEVRTQDLHCKSLVHVKPQLKSGSPCFE